MAQQKKLLHLSSGKFNIQEQPVEVLSREDVKKSLGVGVYILYDKNEPVYVGQSTRVLARLNEHIEYGQMVFDRIEWFEVPEYDLLRVESAMIEELLPKYNETGPRAQARRILDGIDETLFAWDKD